MTLVSTLLIIWQIFLKHSIFWHNWANLLHYCLPQNSKAFEKLGLIEKFSITYSSPQNRNSTINLTPYIFIFQRGKRISKVRVLTKAIDYIKNLHGMVMDHDGIPHSSNHGFNYHEHTADSSLFAFWIEIENNDCYKLNTFQYIACTT